MSKHVIHPSCKSQNTRVWRLKETSQTVTKQLISIPAADLKLIFELLIIKVFIKHLSWAVELRPRRPVVYEAVFSGCLLTRAIQWCFEEL